MKTLFHATRPMFIIASLVACLLGTASAHADGIALNVPHALLALLLTALMHAGANTLNDYYDELYGTDSADPNGGIAPFTGGLRFISTGKLSARATRRLGYFCLLASVPGGLYLSWQSGWGLLAVGLAGAWLGWAYTAAPFRLIYRGLGEFSIALSWALIIVGADYVQRGHFSLTPLAIGLPYALLVAALLTINQFPDHRGDRISGKRTLIVILGLERAPQIYFALVLIAYIWLILQIGLEQLDAKAAIAALPLVLSLNSARQLHALALTPKALAPAIKLTILAALSHGLILSTVLFLHQQTLLPITP